MTAASYLRGEAPAVRVHCADLAQKEREKYEQVWADIPDYGNKSPGVANLDQFLSVMKPFDKAFILDIGCGTGAAGLALEAKGFKLRYLDITGAGLDPRVDRKAFIQQSLWKPLPKGLIFDFGYCVDVLEHIPTEFTMLTITNLMRACTRLWLQIALQPDEFGHAIGKPLHLTVQEFTWWRDRIASVAKVFDARDLGGKAIFVVGR